MPSYTGTAIARASLREIGVLDPIEAGEAELLNDAVAVGTDMIDGWRTERLLIPAITRSVYSLTTSTQTYTIGSGGTFNQDYPQAILSWSVIPDDDAAATALLELPMGRPLTDGQWQGVRVKGQTGSYPTKMWFNTQYAAHLGSLLFHPIPDNGDVDVVLYSAIPELVSLVAGTTYDLRPGYAEAIKTNLAVRLCPRHGRVLARDFPDLVATAREAKAKLKRGNIRFTEAGIRGEFLIGSGASRRTHNIYTDG